MPTMMNAVALSAVGAEKTVSNEIKKLGLSVIESAYGRVSFKADERGLYRALMGLRAADRVLLEAAAFHAADFDALFDGIRDTAWEEYIPPHLGIRVAKVRTNRSRLEAETSIQGVVHKAAAERLCKHRRINRLPESSADPELRIYIEKNRVSALLDLSGDPLFKRGYRISGGPAPIRETTAAALILQSLWKRKFPLYDPFCGSGTIVIEAAMYAWDIAPGLARRFAIDDLLIGSREAAQKVREEFLEKIDFTRLVRVAGSDCEAEAVSAARANIKRVIAMNRDNRDVNDKLGEISLSSMPEVLFRVLSMENAKPGADGIPDEAGFIISNPPYGRRMGDTESAEKIYTEMAGLVKKFPGWKLAVITEHPGFESFFGRKADSCREISNGAIRTYFYQYEKL